MKNQPKPTSEPKFRLGPVLATPTVLECVHQTDILAALARHVTGDWGELDADDQRTNDHAVKTGERILSVYRAANGTKFWVITEDGHTVVLLPQDY